MYEAFVESVSLLKSLEVCMNTNSSQSEYWTSTYLAVFFKIILLVCFFHKLSERMKIVDVLGARAYKDGERIITQVHCQNSCDVLSVLK